jgi:hypothetical protein
VHHATHYNAKGVITMLADAIMSIRRANDVAARRRDTRISRRYPIHLIDSWLGQLESLMEHDNPLVPEPLITEIAGFLGRIDARLYSRLRRNGARETSKVLDALFEAEEQVLSRLVATA